MTFRQNHLLDDEGTCRVHTFTKPVEGTPPSRCCAHCGEPQRYKAPTGRGFEFSDVLVAADDLSALVGAIRAQPVICGMPTPDVYALCDRLEALI